MTDTQGPGEMGGSLRTEMSGLVDSVSEAALAMVNFHVGQLYGHGSTLGERAQDAKDAAFAGLSPIEQAEAVWLAQGLLIGALKTIHDDLHNQRRGA